MKILFAGASGVIGKHTIPLLVSYKHEVLGLTRSIDKINQITNTSANAEVCDVYDIEKLRKIIENFKPDIILNELTDLPDDQTQISKYLLRTSKVRIEGTANLITANHYTKAKIISQSVDWEIPGKGGQAIAQLEKMTLGASGVVLRYGQIYGTGTYYETTKPEEPRVSIEALARATTDSLNLASGIYRVTDDVLLKPVTT